MAASKTKLLDELEAQLVEGRRAVLVIDEAQSVPLELLEEVRLLANIESDTEKLLPVILVGQPELADRLNEPALRQLKQRVALRCTLAALSLREAAGYIAGRIEIAGGEPGQIFSREAVLRIYERSRGIPRTISVICDNALLTGYAEEQRPVGARLIETVCRDFDLPQVGKSAAAARRAAAGPQPSRTRSGRCRRRARYGAHAIENVRAGRAHSDGGGTRSRRKRRRRTATPLGTETVVDVDHLLVPAGKLTLSRAPDLVV